MNQQNQVSDQILENFDLAYCYQYQMIVSGKKFGHFKSFDRDTKIIYPTNGRRVDIMRLSLAPMDTQKIIHTHVNKYRHSVSNNDDQNTHQNIQTNKAE